MEHQILHIKKESIRKILKCGCYINADTRKIQKVKIIYQKARYQENCEKQIEYQKRSYKENPAFQIECNKVRYQENPEILRDKKEAPRKDERMWQGSKFRATSKARTLLYLHNMPSKLVLTQCQII